MTLLQIIRNGKGSAGSNGSWKVNSFTDSNGARQYQLLHYHTLMARWHTHPDSNAIYLDFLGLGHGTVSDQQGMNTLMRHLAAPYYYSRRCGAHYRNLETGAEFHGIESIPSTN